MKLQKTPPSLPWFFSMALFSLGAVAGTYFVISQAEKSVTAVTRTHETIQALEALLSEMRNAESSQRGFLLTGKETYLAPFNQALNNWPVDMQKCRTFLRDDSGQLGRLQDLESAATRKFNELKATISLRRGEGLSAALTLVRTDIGHDIMAQIRTTIHDMQAEEQQKLLKRQRSRNVVLKITAVFIGLLTALLLSSLLSLVLQIRSKGRLFSAWRTSEERFRLLIDGVKDYALYMLDPNGIVSTWTQAAERIKGYKEEEILGAHFSQFFIPEDVAAKKPEWLLETAAAQGSVESEGWRIRKDGSRFWAHVLVTVIRDDAGNILGYSKLARDATEQKKAEETIEQKEQELAQSRKLEAVGRLAGGVAHDFNNLMTGIIGIAEEMEQDSSLAGQKENIGEILAAAHRAGHLTKQLLAFSRRQVASPLVVNMNDLVKEMGKLLKRTIGEDVEFRTFLAPDLGNVRIDPGQIEQVLVNLAINSRDAMPSGGKITIETENVELGDEYVKHHFDVTAGPYVVLIFSDTGIGISPHLQKHIFEPFFSTKDKGTGLGLATVYGIVKQNGGDIFLYSHPGEGTTFKIYLPRVFEKNTFKEKIAPPALLADGKETILLVEDVELVRRVAVKALTQRGYKVLEAKNGNDAWEFSLKYFDTIDLLLTDVVMPGINGRQLAERLAATRPNMKVLYMSGYTQNIVMERGILKPDISFIEKSFTAATLSRKVREVLDMPNKSVVSAEPS